MSVEVVKIQVSIFPAGRILLYNRDRSVRGEFDGDEDALALLHPHGPKSFWLGEIRGGVFQLGEAVHVEEDPGW